MKRSLVAGLALIAGVAIASPLAAWSADGQDQPPAAQTVPAEHGMPGMGMGMRGMHGQDGMGPMGRHSMMQGMGMGMHGMGMHGRPAQRCQEHLARRAAMVAYTVTKLNLTDQQRPLWDKLNAVLQSGTQREQQLCSAGSHQPQTILDRVDRRSKFLEAQLQMLQQVRPMLQQLYEALSPEQQAIIDHPFHRG